MSDYLNRFNEMSIETFSGQHEAEEEARELLAEADRKVRELEEQLDNLNTQAVNIDHWTAVPTVEWEAIMKQTKEAGDE